MWGTEKKNRLGRDSISAEKDPDGAEERKCELQTKRSSREKEKENYASRVVLGKSASPPLEIVRGEALAAEKTMQKKSIIFPQRRLVSF